MKKKLMMSGLLAISMCVLGACSSKASTESDTTAIDSVADTTVVAEEAPAEEDNSVFEAQKGVAEAVMNVALNISSDEKVAKSNCTKSFIKALQNENEFDDGGIPWYCLRTMEQDGDGSSKIVSVEPSGENAVEVKYLDMGNEGKTVLHLVESDGAWKVNSAEITYKGSTRKIG